MPGLSRPWGEAVRYTRAWSETAAEVALMRDVWRPRHAHKPRKWAIDEDTIPLEGVDGADKQLPIGDDRAAVGSSPRGIYRATSPTGVLGRPASVMDGRRAQSEDPNAATQ